HYSLLLFKIESRSVVFIIPGNRYTNNKSNFMYLSIIATELFLFLSFIFLFLLLLSSLFFIFFFFNDTATTEIYTLSLHDALPISLRRRGHAAVAANVSGAGGLAADL